MSRRYSGLQATFMSFGNMDLYRDVVENWRGVAFLYLFLLIAFTWAVMAVGLHLQIGTFVTASVYKTIDQFPTIKINKSEINIDKESPYFVKNPDNPDQVIVAFDTTSDDPEIAKDQNIPVIVTKKKIITHERRGDKVVVEEKPITEGSSSLDGLIIEPETITFVVNLFKNWLGLLLFFLMVPLGFIFCAIQVLIYAVIGKLFANIKNVNLTFGELMRLSVIAITPALVLDTIIKFTHAQMPWWPLAALVVSMIYLFLGVSAQTNKAGPDVVIGNAPTMPPDPPSA